MTWQGGEGGVSCSCCFLYPVSGSLLEKVRAHQQACHHGSFYLAGCPWVEVAGQLCLQIACSLRKGLHPARGSRYEPSGKARLLLLSSPRITPEVIAMSWDLLPGHLTVPLWPLSKCGTFPLPVLPGVDLCPPALWRHPPRLYSLPALPVACCWGSSSNGLSDSAACTHMADIIGMNKR